MSDTAHVLEASRLIEGKGFFERLLDFFVSVLHHAKVTPSSSTAFTCC